MSRNKNVSRVISPVPPSGYWPDLLYKAHSVPPAGVGFRIADSLGRSFRLVKTGEACTVGLMVTNLVTEVACAAGVFDIEPIGETTFNINVTVTEHVYAGGFLELTDSTGAGYLYPVISNTTGISGTTDSIVKIEGEVVVATSATTVGILRSSMFQNVSAHNAADASVEVGVGRAMATSSTDEPYIWVQTWGPCLLKASSAGSVGAGDTIGLGEDANGTVETVVTTENPAFVGLGVAAIANDVWGLCDLKLYP